MESHEIPSSREDRDDLFRLRHLAGLHETKAQEFGALAREWIEAGSARLAGIYAERAASEGLTSIAIMRGANAMKSYERDYERLYERLLSSEETPLENAQVDADVTPQRMQQIAAIMGQQVSHYLRGTRGDKGASVAFNPIKGRYEAVDE